MITKQQLDSESLTLLEILNCIMISLVIIPLSIATHIFYSAYETLYIPNHAVDMITNNTKIKKILKRNSYAII